MADSGRRPVLATLTAAQVPQLGPSSALRGLAAGIDTALGMVPFYRADDVNTFASVLRGIRGGELYDIAFIRAFASGYTATAAQVPQLGPSSALRGLAAGIDTALRLALCHCPDDVNTFASVLYSIRSSEIYDVPFCRAFASGYTLAADEARRIGGLK